MQEQDAKAAEQPLNEELSPEELEQVAGALRSDGYGKGSGGH